MSLEQFSARVVSLFKDRYGSADPMVRNAEVQFVLEFVAASLSLDVRSLQASWLHESRLINGIGGL
jgi:hypothetical protein